MSVGGLNEVMKSGGIIANLVQEMGIGLDQLCDSSELRTARITAASLNALRLVLIVVLDAFHDLKTEKKRWGKHTILISSRGTKQLSGLVFVSSVSPLKLNGTTGMGEGAL